MKKLLKIPVLLFALMLIVTSCGRSPVDDAKTVVNLLDVKVESTVNELYEAEGMEELYEAVKIAEEGAVIIKNVIDVINYYLENKDGYDDFKEALEKIKPSLARDLFGDNYRDFEERMYSKGRRTPGLENLERKLSILEEVIELKKAEMKKEEMKED